MTSDAQTDGVGDVRRMDESEKYVGEYAEGHVGIQNLSLSSGKSSRPSLDLASFTA